MTRSRTLAVLLAAAFAGALLVAAPAGVSTSVIKDADRKGFIPQRKYQSLKGTAIGVLVSQVAPMMAHEGRGGPADAVAFSTNGGNYSWVYVPAAGKGIIQNLNVTVGEKGGKKKVYPALDMANSTTVKRWKIAVPYALVELEVNDGEGAPADQSFVGTKMTRLDDTAKFPLKLPEVVTAIGKRYQTWLKGQQKTIDSVVADVQKKNLKGRKVTGPRETKALFYVTWLPKTERVRLAMRTTISDGAYQYTGGGARPNPLPLPPKKGGALGFFPPPPPRDFKVRYGLTFGVELGMAYEVDKSGKVVRTEELPARGFSTEIPPPPVGRPGGRPGRK